MSSQQQKEHHQGASILKRENGNLQLPNRSNETSASVRSSWNSQAPATITSEQHHNSTPMLSSNSFWGSTKALRDDWYPISSPHTPSMMSVVGVGGTAEDPEGGHRCQTKNLTREGLSWRRLHMSRAKLKATATTSELLSGFAMVAMVELQINTPTNVPEWLFVLFAVCTTVLVSVHIFALMISTYILPNVDAVSKMQHVVSQGDHSSQGESTNILESPHERMRGFIELAWAFSTVLGLFLFLVELAILCWVKFWDYSFTAAWSATIIVVPVLILFVIFVAHFYRSLVEQKVVASSSDLDNLEAMRSSLHEAEVIEDSRRAEVNPDTSHPGLRSRLSARLKVKFERTADEKQRNDKEKDGMGSRNEAGIGLYTPETLSWRRLHVSRAKLKGTVSSSTILCAFALESMVELQVKAPTGCPSWLFSLFAVNTTALISVHVLAAMVSTYILPGIDSVCKQESQDVDPSDSPHESMQGFVEMAWIFSTVLGLFLFLTEVSLLSWVKFWDVSYVAAASGSAAVAPFLLMSGAFCVRFHKVFAGHTYDMRALGLEHVEKLKQQLDANDTTVVQINAHPTESEI